MSRDMWRRTASLTTAVAKERSRLWGLMAGIWPQYEQYRKRTSREIPVVLLERI